MCQQIWYMYIHANVSAYKYTLTHKTTPMTVISNCSTPSQWPKAQSQNPSVQTAITNLSVLHESWNLFSILHFVYSSDKEFWRSNKEVTKIKQLVRDRVWVRKKTDLVPSSPYHSAYLECLSRTHPNPYYSLDALCPEHLISYHLILAATYAPSLCF